ncbi:MAG: SUMO-targeted ubiquitin ligase complex subunit slx8 [Pleopsidium flavum]|nr:MAG: SUMO-targeted ubiquitin ligase complex subunit slx8 [Pleopsidium flavum]
MAQANAIHYTRDVAADFDPLQSMTMGQTQSTQLQIDDPSFLHPGPSHRPTTSSTLRKSFQDQSPPPDFPTRTHSAVSSGRFSTPLLGFTPSPPGLRATITPPGNLDPDEFTLDDSNPLWGSPQPQLSPLRNPSADLISNENNISFRRPSSASRDRSPVEFQFQRSRRPRLEGYIDLTLDGSSPNMPAAAPKRAPSRTQDSRESSSAPVHLAKRQKTQPSASLNTGSLEVKNENEKIDEVDLRDIDDDTGLSKVLEQQRIETIRAQQNDGNKPLKLSSIQCIVCLEPMTNITATSCGHLFCHTCLMESLIAGEQQTEPGKSPLSRCPVCRKRTRRTVPGSAAREIIPLELKLMKKSDLGKGRQQP